MSLGNAKTDCEIKSYVGVKTPTDLDLTKINQARRLSPHVKFLEPQLGTKHYFGACQGRVDIIVSPKKN